MAQQLPEAGVEPYQVSARRWRPQTFGELVGQEHVSRTLVNAIRAGRVAHAFLFTGVRGVGKTTAARVLAKALNCERGPTPEPCNACVNCREITTGAAVDVLEIDGASNTGVDDVREIIENVRYRPAKARLKIYIIDEVHMLSNSAFNALLKTLEEPPSHVKFIFATTDVHKLPATVQSRCQRYDFRRIPLRQVVERLRAIVDSEAVSISDQALFLLAREGEGSMRDAQSLLDQVLAYAGQAVQDEEVLDILGIVDRKLLYEMAGAVLEHDGKRALDILSAVHARGYDMRRLTRDLVEHFRNLAVAKVTAGSLLPDLSDAEREAVVGQAERITQEDCDRAFRVLLETDEDVARSSYPKLILEMAVLRVATMSPLLPLEELVSKLDAVEQTLRRGSTASPSGNAGPATRTSASKTPSAPARSTPKTQSPPRGGAPAGVESEGFDWQGFVGFVTRERPPLAHYLGSCARSQASAEVLTVCAPRGFYFDYLARRDHVEEIAALAAQYFGRALRVEVIALDGAPERKPTAPEPSPAELTEAALGNDTVKAAMQILGGEVQEVRSRGARRREEA